MTDKPATSAERLLLQDKQIAEAQIQLLNQISKKLKTIGKNVLAIGIVVFVWFFLWILGGLGSLLLN